MRVTKCTFLLFKLLVVTQISLSSHLVAEHDSFLVAGLVVWRDKALRVQRRPWHLSSLLVSVLTRITLHTEEREDRMGFRHTHSHTSRIGLRWEWLSFTTRIPFLTVRVRVFLEEKKKERRLFVPSVALIILSGESNRRWIMLLLFSHAHMILYQWCQDNRGSVLSQHCLMEWI